MLNEEDVGNAEQSTGEETGQEATQTQQVEDLDARLDRHPRFQEVYKKMKDYEYKLAEFEKKSAPAQDPDIEELKEWGFDEKKAKRMLEILEKRAERNLAPFQEEARNQRMELGFNKFFGIHPEIDKEVAGEMENLFDALSPEVQRAYARDISSLEMLLARAEKNLGRSYQKGKSDAFSYAQKKREGGSLRGSPAGSTELTEESIANMTPAEFKKREPEIMAKLREIESEEES